LKTIQIDLQTNATIFQFIILTFIYSSTFFWRSPAHHQELNDCSSSLWFYLRIVVTVVLCSWSGRLTGLSAEIVGSNPTGGYGFLSCVTVVCCQVEVSATRWLLIQRSPADCGASLCV